MLRSRRRDKQSAARATLAELAARYSDSPWAPRALAIKADIEDRENLRETDPVLGATVPAALLSNRLLAERYPASPLAETALWKLAETYEDLRRYDLAAEAFERLGSGFPRTRYDAWWRAGELYEKRIKNADKARAAYAQVPPTSRHYRDAQKKSTGDRR